MRSVTSGRKTAAQRRRSKHTLATAVPAQAEVSAGISLYLFLVILGDTWCRSVS